MTSINLDTNPLLEPEDEGSLSGVIGAEKARKQEQSTLINAMASDGVDIFNASVLDSPVPKVIRIVFLVHQPLPLVD